MRYLALLGILIVALCGAQARADGFAWQDVGFGLGLGVDLPADLTVPNLAIASFRYKNMQLQPFVSLSNTKEDQNADDGVVVSHDKASEDTTELGALFKYAFSRRNKMDIQFIASLDYAHQTSKLNPEGPSNASTTKEKTLDLSYGLGVEWWFASNFSLTATATNPLYEKVSTRTTQEDIAGTTSTDDDTRSYGLVWDPNIAFAVVTWF
jgi:outer membrane autotransporter protein